MTKLIINNLWAAWLGFALSAFCNADYSNWQFYATIIPVAILVGFIKK